MRYCIDFPKRVNSDQRVHLRGSHRRVSKQLLDRADIGSTLEKVGGITVPKAVWANAGDIGTHGGLIYAFPCTLARQRFSSAVEEELGCSGSFAFQMQTLPMNIFFDGSHGIRADGDESLLITLSRDDD